MRSSGPGSFLEEAAACRRDFVLVAVGGLTRRAASALVGVLLASRLGPSSFGILSLAIAISLVLVPLGDLGLRTIGWLETARATGRRGITTSVLLAKLLLGLSVSVAILALALLLPLDDRLRVALIICAFQPLFNSEALDWLFRARGQHLLVAVSDLLAAGFQLSLVFWLVRQPGDITVAALGWMGGERGGVPSSGRLLCGPGPVGPFRRNRAAIRLAVNAEDGPPGGSRAAHPGADLCSSVADRFPGR